MKYCQMDKVNKLYEMKDIFLSPTVFFGITKTDTSFSGKNMLFELMVSLQFSKLSF